MGELTLEKLRRAREVLRRAEQEPPREWVMMVPQWLLDLHGRDVVEAEARKHGYERVEGYGPIEVD